MTTTGSSHPTNPPPPPPLLSLCTDASGNGWGAHLLPGTTYVSGQWTQKGKSSTLASPGEACGHQSHPTLVRDTRGKVDRRFVRQHNCWRLHSTTRGHEVKGTVSPLAGTPRDHGTCTDPFAFSSPSRSVERDCRRTLTRKAPSHRVDIPPGSVSESSDSIPVARDRHVCDSIESSSPTLRLPLPRRRSHGPSTDCPARGTGSTSTPSHPRAIPPKVLEKFATSQCSLTLLAPLQWNRYWITRLLELVTEPPRLLPNRPDLLLQPGSEFLHHSLHSLNLHVFRLSSEYSGGKGSRNKSSIMFSNQEGRPL